MGYYKDISIKQQELKYQRDLAKLEAFDSWVDDNYPVPEEAEAVFKQFSESNQYPDSFLEHYVE